MAMKQFLILSVAALCLTACASSPTRANWACHPRGGSTPCADTEQIDHSLGEKGDSAAPDKNSPLAFGAKPARWWSKSDWPTTTRQGDPYRQNDQTMRVVVAPYVDSQGDYHGRSEVFAVVERADWWTVPPTPVSSQPADGQNIDAKGANVLPADDATARSATADASKTAPAAPAKQ